MIRLSRCIESHKLYKDYIIQRDLIKALDGEKGISGNPLTEGPTKDRDDPTINR